MNSKYWHSLPGVGVGFIFLESISLGETCDKGVDGLLFKIFTDDLLRFEFPVPEPGVGDPCCEKLLFFVVPLHPDVPPVTADVVVVVEFVLAVDTEEADVTSILGDVVVDNAALILFDALGEGSDILDVGLLGLEGLGD